LDIILFLWFVIWSFTTNFIWNQNYGLAVHSGLHIGNYFTRGFF